MSVVDKVRQVMHNLVKAFRPENAAGVNGVLLINLTGDDSSKWSLKFHNQNLTIYKGVYGSPNLTLTMDAYDFLAMTLEDVNPVVLFAQGRLKAEGDLWLAWQFRTLFDRSRVEPPKKTPQPAKGLA